MDLDFDESKGGMGALQESVVFSVSQLLPAGGFSSYLHKR